MDDDIFAQFDLEGPKPPPPTNPSDGEPRPNGRKRGRKAAAPKAARGKRGRPKKVEAEQGQGPVGAGPRHAITPGAPRTRAPRKARETKISLTAAAEAFAGLTDSDVAFVTAAIRNMATMTAQQKKRVVHTLTRLFA